MYIKDDISYTRQTDLEANNSGLVIIDVKLKTLTRIVGVYRVFNPPGGQTQRQYFTNQLQLIKQATEQAANMNVVILGDFNLNEELKFNTNYSHKFINRQTLANDWLSCKQKYNNFGYHSNEVQSKGNDSGVDHSLSRIVDVTAFNVLWLVFNRTVSIYSLKKKFS